MSNPRWIPVAIIAAVVAVALVVHLRTSPSSPTTESTPAVKPGGASPPGPNPTAPAQTEHDLAVRSEVPGLRISATHALPPPQTSGPPEEFGFCTDLIVRPQTNAGRAADAAGWHVTSEAALAGYTAVGIFSRGQSGTSGACFVDDGKVAIFQGDALVALVEGNPPGIEPAVTIGGISSTRMPNRLRVSDRTPADFVSADLLFDRKGIAVVPLPAQDIVCGHLVVPNVRGMKIPQVREALARFGWHPPKAIAPDATKHDPTHADTGSDDSEEDRADDAPDDFADRNKGEGPSEFIACSGTGFGFCDVQYHHRDGAILNMTTVGEESVVAGYEAECGEPGRP